MHACEPTHLEDAKQRAGEGGSDRGKQQGRHRLCAAPQPRANRHLLQSAVAPRFGPADRGRTCVASASGPSSAMISESRAAASSIVAPKPASGVSEGLHGRATMTAARTGRVVDGRRPSWPRVPCRRRRRRRRPPSAADVTVRVGVLVVVLRVPSRRRRIERRQRDRLIVAAAASTPRRAAPKADPR